MDYIDNFCAEKGVVRSEVLEVLGHNLYGNRSKNSERDMEILRSIFNGTSFREIASQFGLSVARIRELEKRGRVHVQWQIQSLRSIIRYTSICSYEDAAALFECAVEDIHTVFGNPRLCLMHPDDQYLDMFIDRLGGATLEELQGKFHLGEDEVKTRLTSTAAMVERSIETMHEESTLWDKDRETRTLSRCCRRWGVQPDDIRAALMSKAARHTERGRKILTYWLEGASAADVVKDADVPYKNLRAEFNMSWPILREQLRVLKQEQVLAAVHAKSDCSSVGG